MSAHTLTVIRHSQAGNAASDRDRPLTDRGREDARRLGAALSEVLRSVDTAFVSPAVRAQQTWANLLEGAGVDPAAIEVRTEEVIYSSGDTQIWDEVRFGARGRGTVVVGHEPTISGLADLIAKDRDPDISWGMPTSGAVVLEFGRDWKEWHHHCAKILRKVGF